MATYLNGTVTDSIARAPDSAQLSPTGDMDIRVLARAVDWAITKNLFTKRSSVDTTQAEFHLFTRNVAGAHQLGFMWWNAAVQQILAHSTVAHSGVDGQWHALRVTLDVDNGGGQRVITYYEKDATALGPTTDIATDAGWTQYDQLTQAGTTDVRGTVATAVEIGSERLGVLDQWPDDLAKVVWKSGIGGAGTVIASPDFTALTAGQTSYTDVEGNVWTFGSGVTIEGSADEPQFARPDADDTDGTWTDQAGGTTLFDKIDEVTASDTDFIRSALAPANDVCKIRLSDVTDPEIDIDHRLQFRYSKDPADSNIIELRARILEGTTERAIRTLSGIGTAWTDEDFAITTFAATDYTNLFLELRANQTAGTPQVTHVLDHTGSSSASGTSIVGTLAAAVPAGRLLVAWFGFDNISTTTPTITSVSKPGGEANNWARVASHDSSTAANSAGVRGEMWAILTTVEWASGTTVTGTLSGSPPKSTVTLREFSGASATLRGTAGTGTSAGGAPSATTGGTAPVAGDLVLGGATFESGTTPTADSDTTNGSWDAGVGQVAGGGAAAARVSSFQQFKIVTAGGNQTYNPTESNDSGAAVVALQPAVLANARARVSWAALEVPAVPPSAVEAVVDHGIILGHNAVVDLVVDVDVAHGIALDHAVTTVSTATAAVAHGLALDHAIAADLQVDAVVSHGIALDHQVVAEEGGTTSAISHGIALDHAVVVDVTTPNVSVGVSHGIALDHQVIAEEGATTSAVAHGITLEHSAVVDVRVEVATSHGIVLSHDLTSSLRVTTDTSHGIAFDHVAAATLRVDAIVTHGIVLAHDVMGATIELQRVYASEVVEVNGWVNELEQTTGVQLAASVDEPATPNDADFIRSPDDPTTADPVVIRAQTATDPNDDRFHFVTFRAESVVITGVPTHRLTPVWRTGYVDPGDRGTVIKTGSLVELTASMQNYVLSLAEAETANVPPGEYATGVFLELVPEQI